MILSKGICEWSGLLKPGIATQSAATQAVEELMNS